MREIRGWQIGEVVTASDMTLDSANMYEQTGANGAANLPCIYNGLTLQSQSGAGNSIVTFNPGVARCQDLPTSVYTYLPPNNYGNSYPCFIDISTLDSNTVITLTTTPSPGYIVATFSISPNTSGATDYVITGSLLQIDISSYNPAIHVRLCQYIYTGSTFVLDFTPKVHRDTDLTGLGGLQWNYQNSSLILDTPASQSGSSIVAAQTLTCEQNLIVQGTGIIQSGDALRFYNAANTHYTGLQAGSNTSDVNFKLPIADGIAGQAMVTNGALQLSFANVSGQGNIAANDSNVIFTSSSNPTQYCTPTAPRTYTMPASLTAGVTWTFYNQATSWANCITIQSSGANIICFVPPNGFVSIVPLTNTPTSNTNWIIQNRHSIDTNYSPTIVGAGSVSNINFFASLHYNRMSIQGIFQTGTPTATLFSISLPFSFTWNTSLVIASTFNNTCGTIATQGATPSSYYVLENSGSNSVVTAGLQDGSNGGLNAANGNTLFTNNVFVGATFSIPVSAFQ